MDATTARVIAMHIPPERVELLRHTSDLLVELGLTFHEDTLYEYLSRYGVDSDGAIYISRVEDCLYYQVETALIQHGLHMSEMADLRVMVAFLEAVTRVSQYLIPQELETLIRDADSPELAIVSLTSLLTDAPEEWLIEALLDIRPSVITRLCAYLDERLITVIPEDDEAGPTTSETRRAIIRRVNYLQRWIESRQAPLLVRQLAEQGYGIGSSMDTLISASLDTLDGLSTDRLGIELLAMAYYTTPTGADPMKQLREHTADFTDDYEERVRIEDTARRYHTEVEQYA